MYVRPVWSAAGMVLTAHVLVLVNVTRMKLVLTVSVLLVTVESSARLKMVSVYYFLKLFLKEFWETLFAFTVYNIFFLGGGKFYVFHPGLP